MEMENQETLLQGLGSEMRQGWKVVVCGLKETVCGVSALNVLHVLFFLDKETQGL